MFLSTMQRYSLVSTTADFDKVAVFSGNLIENRDRQREKTVTIGARNYIFAVKATTLSNFI